MTKPTCKWPDAGNTCQQGHAHPSGCAECTPDAAAFLKELQGAANAVYLATDTEVADHLSALLRRAATAISEERARRDAEDDWVSMTVIGQILGVPMDDAANDRIVEAARQHVRYAVSLRDAIERAIRYLDSTWPIEPVVALATLRHVLAKNPNPAEVTGATSEAATPPSKSFWAPIARSFPRRERQYLPQKCSECGCTQLKPFAERPASAVPEERQS